MMTSANRDFEEKRNYIRMKVNAPVAVSLNSDGTEYSGTCLNLSGGGMLVELDNLLPVGAETLVTISSGQGHNPMLKARASVARVISQPEQQDGTCLLGFQIIEVLN